LASVYWAIVSCTTVGYGDIVATNGYEMGWGMIIIVVGAAVFSFVLGDLSSQFSELTRSSRAHSDIINQINELDNKFNLGITLVDKLTTYVEQNAK
jgi:hypothetical protein